jgi:two-component system chemotaxis response regulator CheY
LDELARSRSDRAVSRGVLIVDDDRFIRRLIAATLEDASRLELHEACDGLEALGIARQERPAVVFLDVDMPRLGGIEACRRLRAEESTRDATIVMLTAAHDDGVEGSAEAAGADLFLTKPFSPLELLRLVDRLAESARV